VDWFKLAQHKSKDDGDESSGFITQNLLLSCVNTQGRTRIVDPPTQPVT